MAEKLKVAIEKFDEEAARKAAQEAIDAGVDPKVLLKSLHDSMKKLGNLFNEGQGIFFPQMWLASNAFDAALKVIEPKISKEELEASWLGTIVLGTVEGDWNDLGLNTVACSLRGAGFRVYDLGVSVPARVLVDKALEVNADIIGVSCLLWSQVYKMRDVVEELEVRGLRDRFKVLVGGGGLHINPDWPERIGADGVATDSFETIEVIKKLAGK